MVLQIISIIVSVLGFFLILLQLRHMHKQTELDLERSRREKAVEVVREWNKGIMKETSFAQKIVENLDEKQCRSLYKQENFFVSQEIKKQLCNICPYQNTDHCEKNCKSKSGKFEVKDLQLSELRWHIIQYLNNLETVMIAWKNSVVDLSIIEEQFRCLHDPEKGRDASKKFRDIAGGGRSYPCIEMFMNNIKESQMRNGEPAKSPLSIKKEARTSKKVTK